MVTEEMLTGIERIFGFKLYDWQKEYILGKTDVRKGGRRNGNTFAYCIRLLLSDGEPIPRKYSALRSKADAAFPDEGYKTWFARYLLEINDTLTKAGFKTRIKS